MINGRINASLVNDGDGNRTKNAQFTQVKGTIGGVTSIYIGNYFEWTGSTSSMKKYYYAGNTRVAMRTAQRTCRRNTRQVARWPGSSTLNYLLGDHLGSQAITASSSGGLSAEIRYYPWGTERYTSGTTPHLGLILYNLCRGDPSQPAHTRSTS